MRFASVVRLVSRVTDLSRSSGRAISFDRANLLSVMSCLLLCLHISIGISAAAELSIPFATVKTQGASAVLNVHFTPQGANVSAIQFDLLYDTNALTIDAVAGAATAAAGKSLAAGTLPNGTVRFVVLGFNQTTLDTGSLVDLTVRLNSSSADGTYSLKLLNVIAVDPSSAVLNVAAHDGGLRLATGPFVTVTANGFHGSVMLDPDSSLQIAIAVDGGPNGLTNPSDLYVGVSTPVGLFWLSSSGFTSQISPVLSGVIPTFGPVVLLNIPGDTAMPNGGYTWFVVVLNGGSGVVADAVQTIVT